MGLLAKQDIIFKKRKNDGKGEQVTSLYFEELERAEELFDAKDYGAVFGVGFLAGVIIFVAT